MLYTILDKGFPLGTRSEGEDYYCVLGVPSIKLCLVIGLYPGSAVVFAEFYRDC